MYPVFSAYNEQKDGFHAALKRLLKQEVQVQVSHSRMHLESE